MTVVVDFPDELLTAIKEAPEAFRKQVRIYTLGKLYQEGRISGGYAAEILGCSRWEFYEMLSQHGFSVIDYPDEELDAEGKADEAWLKSVQENNQ